MKSKIFLKDNYSKRGTFVRAEAGNPFALYEGNMFMVSDNYGFCVKKIDNGLLD